MLFTLLVTQDCEIFHLEICKLEDFPKSLFCSVKSPYNSSRYTIFVCYSKSSAYQHGTRVAVLLKDKIIIAVHVQTRMTIKPLKRVE